MNIKYFKHYLFFNYKSMSIYKVDADKGFRILTAVFPKLTFVNGLSFSGINAFVDKFKKTDFNVLKVQNVYDRLAAQYKPKSTLEESKSYINAHFELGDDEAELGEFPGEIEDALVRELHNYMNRFQNSPSIIVGNLGSVKLLDRIFDNDHQVFTYVYIYPNKAAIYKQRIADAVVSAIKNKTAGDREFNNLVEECGKDKKTYIKMLNAYTRNMLNRRKTIYKSHTEEFGRCLTILT